MVEEDNKDNFNYGLQLLKTKIKECQNKAILSATLIEFNNEEEFIQP